MRLANFRDVGGLPVSPSGVVRSGVLYRSDAPRPGDEPESGAWPPATVIDLRRPSESDGNHPLAGANTEVVPLPLFEAISLVAMAADARHMSLRDLYVETLESAGDRIAEAVSLIANSPAPVLVHCAVGKDRTGLVVAAALAAVGVPPEMIAADYHATDENMEGAVARIALDLDANEASRAVAQLGEHLPQLLRAPPDGMDAVLAVFDAAEGGAAGWLREHGMDEPTLQRLRERLVE
ncbi:MAG: protein-tyrosine phosphatase [Thermoleophilaceae bacterium]|nr:protein-tyrosine phosphatase [Thermoleophilaceae bacterium]